MTIRRIWYVSKYLAIPDSMSLGGRGFHLMQQIAEAGVKCLIVRSGADAEWEAEASDWSFDHTGELAVCTVRTGRFEAANSWRRILSWFQFEMKVARLPTQSLAPPDVVIVSSLSLLSLLSGFRLRRKYRCPFVFEVRDIWPLTLTEEGGFSKRHPGVRLLAWLERRGYERADLIVGTMPNLGEHVNGVVGRERPVACVPMGVSAAQVDAFCGPLKPVTLPVPSEAFLVAHAGSVGVTNALATFLECATLMKSDRSVHFLIVGDGDLRTQYMNEYGGLPNLTFLEKVPQSDIPSVLNECDLLYFASFDSEVWKYGQSLNKVVDYMLAAKPIVGSYSGFPSMINEARSGSFVPAEDPIALRDEIIRYRDMDEGVRAEMGRRGRKWLLANRTYKRLSEEYLALLEQVVRAKRGEDPRS